MQSQKLEKLFYKEMDPITKEGMKWNVSVWRVNGNLRSQKYFNPKFDHDEQQIVEKQY